MKTKSALAVWLAIVFLASGAVAQTSGPAEQIDELMRYCHEKGMFNGVILVKQDGKKIYEQAWGLADLRDGRELTTDTAFYLASVSKQFTAMGAMLLVERGQLSLDSKLSEFFPQFPAYADGITVQDLMTHTSGIPDYYSLMTDVADGFNNAQVLEILTAVPELEFEPGSRFSYSNGAYVLLSMIVAKAARQPFPEFMKENIFVPLGMGRTLVYDESRPEIVNRAVGFDPYGDLDDYTILTTGAGGMYSTVGDLSTWDDALYGGKLVRPETLDRAFSPTRLNNGEMSDYGFGWGIRMVNDRKIVSHTGGLDGFRTMIVRDLERKNAVIMLTNFGDTMNFIELWRQIAAILDGKQASMPKAPVGLYLAHIIEREGLAAALVAYDEIQAQGGDSSYDLGEEQLNSLSDHFLARGEIDTAIVLFEKNAEAFPESFNVYDSLGGAFMAKGVRREAIINYAKSLVLNPDNQNALRMLTRLQESSSVD
jgi:CubicO group peptidase (beta-lactamase class C family)